MSSVEERARLYAEGEMERMRVAVELASAAGGSAREVGLIARRQAEAAIASAFVIGYAAGVADGPRGRR